MFSLIWKIVGPSDMNPDDMSQNRAYLTDTVYYGICGCSKK